MRVFDLRALAVLVGAAVSLGATCDDTGGRAACPTGLVRSPSTSVLCVPRCALPSSDTEYAACPQGFMCDPNTACFQVCGSSSCHPGERCNTQMMRCERIPDAGTVLDAGTDSGARTDTGVAPATDTPIAVMDSPVAVMDSPVAVMDTPVAVTDTPVAVTDTPVAVTDTPVAVTDAGPQSCSLGLPTSGTTTMLGSGSAIASALRLAVSDTHVVWSDGASITLARADGSSTGMIARRNVQDLALNGRHLYFVESSTTSTIYRVELTSFGVTEPQMIYSSGSSIPHFALAPDGIFWVQEDASGATLSRAPLDGLLGGILYGEIRFAAGTSERIVDMGVAGGQVYVAMQKFLGTSGCFRVVRFDGGPVQPTSLNPTPVYGPTAVGCSSTTWANLAFDGASVFFHSSSPAEIVEYAQGSTAYRFANGFGDGTFLGLTSRCVIGSNAGLFGISRAIPVSGARIPLGLTATPIGRIAVHGPWVYGSVMNRSLYQVFRYGL